MFVDGHTYLEIADQLNISRSRAHALVTDALADHTKECEEIANRALPIVLARLDRLYKPQAKLAAKGDVDAANICIKIIDRYIKVHGLERIRADLTITTRTELDAEIEALIAGLNDQPTT